MSDLDRLFRRLVDGLIAIDPARLHRPLTVAELVRSIVPYRTSRTALGLDSSEDYDLLILRLLSGEGGYAEVKPVEVAARAAAELGGANPDPALLRQFGGVEVTLATARLAQALGPGPDAAWAPPEGEEALEAREALEGHEDEIQDDVDAGVIETGRVPWTVEAITGPRGVIPLNTGAVPDEGTRCGYCGGLLPGGRQVNFCPHCGQSQTFIRCGECGSEVEFGWKHCVACGASVGEEE
ncbi:MAG TPA: zinc ribbon domain-containing protein [Gemmatimonadales bacterium]|nr:zinc ribbon domain-containing protein [Gemmatimonadales bacterium]